MANIPGAIVTGGGQRQDPWLQLLMGLVGSAGQMGIQRLMQPSQPPNVQQQLLEGEQEFALGEIMQRPEGAQLAAMAGNANVPTSTFTRERSAALKTAPQRLAQIQAEQKAAEEAALAEEAARLEQEAYDRTMTRLGEDVENGPLLQRMFDASVNAKKAGLGDSVINTLLSPQLPQSAKDKLDIQTADYELQQMKDSDAADAYATTQLIKMGALPSDAPAFKGAADLMLSLAEAQGKAAADKAINWTERGLSFVAQRVGEAVGGTGMTFIAGMPSMAGGTTDDTALTVKRAIAEWQAMIQYLDPDAAAREIPRMQSGAWQRGLSIQLAIDEMQKALDAGVNPEAARQTFEGSFTKDEINTIVRRTQERRRPTTPVAP